MFSSLDNSTIIKGQLAHRPATTDLTLARISASSDATTNATRPDGASSHVQLPVARGQVRTRLRRHLQAGKGKRQARRLRQTSKVRPSQPHTCALQPPQLPRLTRVEVLGLGKLDGGSSFLLQLDNGLASFADDGAGSITGNQDLQEVLAVLCKEGNRKGACEGSVLRLQARGKLQPHLAAI